MRNGMIKKDKKRGKNNQLSQGGVCMGGGRGVFICKKVNSNELQNS